MPLPALVLLLLALVAATGCAAPQRPPIPSPPWPVDPASLSPDLRVEQSLLVRFRGRSFLARGVVVKKGGVLDVWVITPTGIRLAHFRQEGLIVESDVRAEEWKALDPRFLLQDVRWMFFSACPRRGDATVVTCFVGDARFTERFDPATGDRLEREIEREGARERMVFSGHAGEGEARWPRRITLENPTFGYGMEVVVDVLRTGGGAVDP